MNKRTHIQLFCFPFIVFYKQNINLTEIFLCKIPDLGFSFLPPVSFAIVHCRFFQVGFSSFLPSTD